MIDFLSTGERPRPSIDIIPSTPPRRRPTALLTTSPRPAFFTPPLNGPLNNKGFQNEWDTPPHSPLYRRFAGTNINNQGVLARHPTYRLPDTPPESPIYHRYGRGGSLDTIESRDTVVTAVYSPMRMLTEPTSETMRTKTLEIQSDDGMVEPFAGLRRTKSHNTSAGGYSPLSYASSVTDSVVDPDDSGSIYGSRFRLSGVTLFEDEPVPSHRADQHDNSGTKGDGIEYGGFIWPEIISIVPSVPMRSRPSDPQWKWPSDSDEDEEREAGYDRYRVETQTESFDEEFVSKAIEWGINGGYEGLAPQYREPVRTIKFGGPARREFRYPGY